MSDEMVTLTSDSPAGATDNASETWSSSDGIDAGSVQDAQGATSAEPAGTDVIDDSYLENLLGLAAQQQQPGNVPYERFREVNEKAKQVDQFSSELTAWQAVIDEFKQQGFNSAADVQAALAAQQQQAEEQEIRDRYDQLQNANVLDAQSAYAQQEAEISKLRYERQMAQVQQYMMAQQTQQAMQSYPLAQRAPELVNNLVGAGIDPNVAAEFVHNQVKGIAKTLVPELTTKLVNTNPTPISGGRPAANPQPPKQPGAGLSTLTQLLGISRNQNPV